MRRATPLLLRLLLSLALIVAAWPVRAAEASCAPLVRPVCGMACCAARPCAKMGGFKVIRKAVCPCAVRTALPKAPAQAAVVPVSEWQVLASPLPFDDVLPPRLLAVEPRIVGVDAGPPPDPPHRSNASRAPPVVRA